MKKMVDRTISLPVTLVEEVERLAQAHQLAPDQLVARALEEFITRYQGSVVQRKADAAPRRVVRQGEIYWAQSDDARDFAPDFTSGVAHPYVVIQEDLLNHSRIATVVACALTSNVRRASETPGNILLEAGEANLPKQSVVEVSKVTTLAKAQLGEYVGTLSAQRVGQILAGMRFLQMSYFDR